MARFWAWPFDVFVLERVKIAIREWLLWSAGSSGRSDPNPGGVINIIGVGSNYTDKAKPAERLGRKATGPRVLRDAPHRRHEGPQDGRAAQQI